jgi:hypothetical protein
MADAEGDVTSDGHGCTHWIHAAGRGKDACVSNEEVRAAPYLATDVDDAVTLGAANAAAAHLMGGREERDGRFVADLADAIEPYEEGGIFNLPLGRLALHRGWVFLSLLFHSLVGTYKRLEANEIGSNLGSSHNIAQLREGDDALQRVGAIVVGDDILDPRLCRDGIGEYASRVAVPSKRNEAGYARVLEAEYFGFQPAVLR